MEGIQENVQRALYFKLESYRLTTLSFPRGKQEVLLYRCLHGLLHMTIHKETFPLLWVLTPSACFPSFAFSTLVGLVPQETDSGLESPVQNLSALRTTAVKKGNISEQKLNYLQQRPQPTH